MLVAGVKAISEALLSANALALPKTIYLAQALKGRSALLTLRLERIRLVQQEEEI